MALVSQQTVLTFLAVAVSSAVALIGSISTALTASAAPLPTPISPDSSRPLVDVPASFSAGSSDFNVNSTPSEFSLRADEKKVLIESNESPRVFVLSPQVPSGGRLVPAIAVRKGEKIKSEILVEDSLGAVIGAYDNPSALDAAGNRVPSSFRVNGSSLSQTVIVDDSVVFPIVSELIYSSVGNHSHLGMVPFTAGSLVVEVPDNYYYNPAWGTLHDYCSYSPDEFPAPFANNADFRGPCARHDLCYSDGQGTSKFTCDNRLLVDMKTNCNYQYSWCNPLLESCLATAAVYWSAVVVGR